MADYMTQLNDKLEAARERVRRGREVRILKENAPSLFEVMDLEITTAVNKMTAEKPVSYDEYLSLHGQVVGIRKVRNILNQREAEEVAASQEVEALSEQLNHGQEQK